MILTKPFRLPFPQKSSKSTNLATPTLIGNPTTDSLPSLTLSTTINNSLTPRPYLYDAPLPDLPLQIVLKLTR